MKPLQKLLQGSLMLFVLLSGLQSVAQVIVPASSNVKPGRKSDSDNLTIAAPTNVTPGDGKVFTKIEANKPMQLRWTWPVPPPPNNDIMYTVHVYAVEKGQSPAQAAKTNTPVFVKEVNTTQTTWQIPTQFTSSKETQTFVWNVQLTKAGKPFGRNNGISAPTTFSYRKEVLATGKVVIQ